MQLIHFKICSYVYRILSNITWGKNKHETILQVNTFQNVKVYIHNSNITWGKYKYGIILRSKKRLIYFKACRCTYRIMSNIIRRIYKYRTKLQLIIQLIHFKFCRCIYWICSNTKWGKNVYVDNIAVNYIFNMFQIL